MRLVSVIVGVIAFSASATAAPAFQYMNNPNTDTGSLRAIARESLAPGIGAMAQLDAVQRMADYSPAQRQRLIERTQTLLERASTPCDVQQALSVGQTQRRQEMFEVSCASGMGYLVVGGSEVAVYDCLEIAQAAQAARAENPRARIGSQCVMPENGGSL